MNYPNGSGASALKFEAVLCRQCNSARSQPFDRAYERFAAFVREHGDEIYDSGRLDWEAIFPEAWRDERAQVVRYWVKHIACRLAERSITIAPRLVDFLGGASEHAHLRLRLEIRSEFVLLQRAEFEEHGEEPRALWMGDLIGWSSRSTGAFQGASSHWGIDGLFLNWEYDTADGSSGSNFEGRVNAIPIVGSQRN